VFRQVRIHPLFDMRLRQAFPQQVVRDEFVIMHLKGILDEFAEYFEELPMSRLGPEWRRTYGFVDELSVAFTVLAREVSPEIIELRSIAAEIV